MSRKNNRRDRRNRRTAVATARTPWMPAFTLADRVLAAGQHLRANETVSRLTMRLPISAQWIQAKGGAR
jgi:hypothetical protein